MPEEVECCHAEKVTSTRTHKRRKRRAVDENRQPETRRARNKRRNNKRKQARRRRQRSGVAEAVAKGRARRRQNLNRKAIEGKSYRYRERTGRKRRQREAQEGMHGIIVARVESCSCFALNVPWVPAITATLAPLVPAHSHEIFGAQRELPHHRSRFQIGCRFIGGRAESERKGDSLAFPVFQLPSTSPVVCNSCFSFLFFEFTYASNVGIIAQIRVAEESTPLFAMFFLPHTLLVEAISDCPPSLRILPAFPSHLLFSIHLPLHPTREEGLCCSLSLFLHYLCLSVGKIASCVIPFVFVWYSWENTGMAEIGAPE